MSSWQIFLVAFAIWLIITLSVELYFERRLRKLYEDEYNRLYDDFMTHLTEELNRTVDNSTRVNKFLHECLDKMAKAMEANKDD